MKPSAKSYRARALAARRSRWRSKNATAIAGRNERIARRGVFSQRLQRF